MFERHQEIIKTFIGSSLVLILPAILYVAAYHYEKAYLEAMHVPTSYAKSVVEVSLITYIDLLGQVIAIGIILATIGIFIYKSLKVRQFIKSLKGVLVFFGIFLIILMAQYVVVNKLGVPEDSTTVRVIKIFAGILAVIDAFYIIAINIDRDFFLAFQKDSKASVFSKLILAFFGLYFIHLSFTMIASSLGGIAASMDRPLTRISYEGKTYDVIREYGDKIIATEESGKDPKDREIKVFYTPEFKNITVKRP